MTYVRSPYTIYTPQAYGNNTLVLRIDKHKLQNRYFLPELKKNRTLGFGTAQRQRKISLIPPGVIQVCGSLETDPIVGCLHRRCHATVYPARWRMESELSISPYQSTDAISNNDPTQSCRSVGESQVQTVSGRAGSPSVVSLGGSNDMSLFSVPSGEARLDRRRWNFEFATRWIIGSFGAACRRNER